MKKSILITTTVFAYCLLQTAYSFSQGTAINNNGMAADGSAMLDVSSTNKGILLPRMTTGERNAIVSPAQSLMIFNTSDNCFEFYQNGVWQTMVCGCTGSPSSVSAVALSASLCSGNTLMLIGAAEGATAWNWTGPNGFSSTQQSPAIPHITTSASGVYSLVAGNACGSSAAAKTDSVIVSNTLSAPTASAASGETTTSFQANWSASAGALGYYIDVSTGSSFSNFVSGYNNLYVGNVISYTVTGLSPNTAYYYRLKAYNLCAMSGYSGTISCSTTWTCGTTLIKTHTAGSAAPENKTINYGTLSTDITGSTKCWITQNLGADNQASAYNDATNAAAGWYWQFNRSQGYQVGTTPSWTITTINENSNWETSNDPCNLLLGPGWRIPTLTEWENAKGAPRNWANYYDVYNSILKIHCAGFLDFPDGSLHQRAYDGDYWSATQGSTTNSWGFIFVSDRNTMDNDSKAYGFSVRCLKD